MDKKTDGSMGQMDMIVGISKFLHGTFVWTMWWT